MIGLRDYPLHRGLPALAGDHELVLPDESELLDWIRRHCPWADGLELRSARWLRARWKPGISVTGVARVDVKAGEPGILTLKLFHGPAPSDPTPANPESDWAAENRRLRISVPGRNVVLSLWPHDRRLPQLSRILRPGRMARLVEECACFGEERLKARTARLERLRYKPERRAVFRYDVELHRPAVKPRRRSLCVRLQPAKAAAETLHARRAFARVGHALAVPALLGGDTRLGVLFEEWLTGEANSRHGFMMARSAGKLLAALHGVAAPTIQVRALVAPPAHRDAGLYGMDSDLGQRWGEVLPPRSDPPRAWVHGDLHADQFLLGESGQLHLLDLDELALGSPDHDLASWIADHLASSPAAGLEEVSSPLLEGYCTGGAALPHAARLLEAVRWALRARAAAGIRRLERGAVEQARELWERARSLKAEALA